MIVYIDTTGKHPLFKAHMKGPDACGVLWAARTRRNPWCDMGSTTTKVFVPCLALKPAVMVKKRAENAKMRGLTPSAVLPRPYFFRLLIFSASAKHLGGYPFEFFFSKKLRNDSINGWLENREDSYFRIGIRKLPGRELGKSSRYRGTILWLMYFFLKEKKRIELTCTSNSSKSSWNFTPLDYFLWGTVKFKSSANHPKPLAEW